MVSISKIVFSIPMLITILVTLQFTDGKIVSNVFFNVPSGVRLYITNNITNTPLGVHCRGDNFDYGFRRINFGGIYNINFIPFVSTIRSCQFSWNNEFHNFDIYVQERDYYTCKKECHWAINKSGPCMIRQRQPGCFNWNS
ncbi:hypothetical protein QL285_017699 [Trifolium repens]|nr:hypothetical protein QL285_017699 [Trifolium repens]